MMKLDVISLMNHSITLRFAKIKDSC